MPIIMVDIFNEIVAEFKKLEVTEDSMPSVRKNVTLLGEARALTEKLQDIVINMSSYVEDFSICIDDASELINGRGEE